MPQDSMGNEVMLGDWVRAPDSLYPWTTDTHMIYGSSCRSVQVSHVFANGIVEIRFNSMRDLRHLENSDPFTYTYQLGSTEVLRICEQDTTTWQWTTSPP